MSASRKQQLDYVPINLEVIKTSTNKGKLEEVLNYLKETNEEAERKLEELAVLCDSKR